MLTKHGSMTTRQQWKNSQNGGLHPANVLKVKMVLSAGKFLAAVFRDSRGIIFTDYLEKGRTITGHYYADLLGRFEDELMNKWPHLAKKKVLFHHDNAQADSSAIATAKLVELRYELLDLDGIYFCSQTWKNGLVESYSRQTRKSSPQQWPILRSSINQIFWMAGKG